MGDYVENVKKELPQMDRAELEEFIIRLAEAFETLTEGLTKKHDPQTHRPKQ